MAPAPESVVADLQELWDSLTKV